MRHYLGIPDEDFICNPRVTMIRKEVRVLTLVKANIPEAGIVWDIGAGTGSLAIEAASLCPRGKVCAIERDMEAISLLRLNIANLAVPNIGITMKAAPEGLAELPNPDCVLIIGVGEKLKEILDTVTERLHAGGHLVMDCATVQTMYNALNWFHEHEDVYEYEAVQVQVTQLHQTGGHDRLQAESPICIISAVRKADPEQAA
jgi:precorrin-6Y C5,15-methyltransferase (decarboxylating) CbiT subunit